MAGEKIATWSSILRHQKAEPSNENESQRWKWTKSPIWTKMLQKTNSRNNGTFGYLLSFINPQKMPNNRIMGFFYAGAQIEQITYNFITQKGVCMNRGYRVRGRCSKTQAKKTEFNSKNLENICLYFVCNV